MSRLRPSAQQHYIATLESDHIVEAIAGSGKSTSLLEHAARRPRARKILICFNRDAAESARIKSARMGIQNLECTTAHSLAYRKMGIKSARGDWPLEEILELRKEKDTWITRSKASLARKTLSFFCQSSNKNIEDIYELMESKNLSHDSKKNMIWACETAIMMWREMAASRVPITHDYYLKAWSLNDEDLKKDFIYYDEVQDSDSSMLAIFLSQSGVRLAVGDPFQSLYLWRGAINAILKLDWPRASLTESFRFGPLIAQAAEDELFDYKRIGRTFEIDVPSIPNIIGAGRGPANDGSICYISRTNAGVIAKAIDLVHDGEEEINILGCKTKLGPLLQTVDGTSIYDLLSLQSDKMENIKNPFVKGLRSFSNALQYAEECNDQELSSLLNLCKKYGGSLFGLIPEVEKALSKDPKTNTPVLSTTHKVKGLTYDRVIMLSDFCRGPVFTKELEKMLKENYDGKHTPESLQQEVNMRYVALTRARDTVEFEDDGSSVTG